MLQNKKVSRSNPVLISMYENGTAQIFDQK